MCERGTWLAGYDESAKVRRVIQTNCDSWQCDYCARRKQSEWRYRIRKHLDKRAVEGVKFFFLTLTRPANEHVGNANDSLQTLKRNWHRTAEYFRRQLSPIALEYVSVIEFHKSGLPHQHLLINYSPGDVELYSPSRGTPMMRSRSLSARLEHYGYGWVHHIEPVADSAAAGRYVSKYLAKGLDLMRKRMKLITCSKNWAKAPVADFLSDLQWLRIPYAMDISEAQDYVYYVTAIDGNDEQSYYGY